MKLRVNEAIARSEANGKKVLKKDIQSKRLFPVTYFSSYEIESTLMFHHIKVPSLLQYPITWWKI